MPAPVLGLGRALEPAGLLEPGDELRDGCARDPRAPRELGAGQPLAGNRAQRQVLGHRQRRLARRQEALDPASCERGGRGEGVDGIGTNARAGHMNK